MKIVKFICDLCLLDGDENITAKWLYFDEEGNLHHICKTHKAIVEEAEIETQKIDTEEYRL